MKKLKFLGLAAIAAGMVSLTSCLDGGGNQSSGQTFGIVETDYTSLRRLVYPMDNLPWYSPVIANATDISDGDCIYFSYSINGDDPVNQGANPFTTVIVPDKGYVIVPKGTVSPYLSESDTAVVKNELSITAVQIGVIKNRIILSLTHPSAKSDQTNSYMLSYESDKVTEEDGKRVYELYAHATKVSDGKNATGSNAFTYVYDTRGFWQMATRAERNEGKDNVYFRINYHQEFNADTTACVWGATDVFTYPIPKEEQK